MCDCRIGKPKVSHLSFQIDDQDLSQVDHPQFVNGNLTILLPNQITKEASSDQEDPLQP